MNRVPLAITATTQQTLERRGDKNAQDLFRATPGISLRITGQDMAPKIAIRGIATNGGPPTTAIYLDDAPLQKRLLGGIPSTGSGSPLPGLFDLERVEVLLGPQGTLYGGSSMGGTIRFITPTPSLTQYSGLVRAEASKVEMGSPGYDVGVAVGGPIIEDKLGFRVSARNRRVGGYIDAISRLDGKRYGKDTNYLISSTYRGALLWRPAENFQVTTTAYYNTDKVGDVDVYWENLPAITVPTRSYLADGRTRTTDPALAAFTLAGRTYGPYNFYGPGRSGNVTNVGDNFYGIVPMKAIRSPQHQRLAIINNNIQYEFPLFTVNLIATYSKDRVVGNGDCSYCDPRDNYGSPFVYTLPQYTNNLAYDNRRNADTEELRLTSKNEPDQRLTWVIGGYRSNSRQKTVVRTIWNWGDMTQVTRGVNEIGWFGVGYINPTEHLAGFTYQRAVDSELAGYANANYLITSKLKLIAGIRASRIGVDFKQVRLGQTAGSLTPIVVSGTNRETPITPKFGVSYQVDEQTLLFANAAKGYRPGGVNVAAPQIRCAADFAQIGIASNPLTYASDSLWNYEGGVKMRLFGRAQVNANIFYSKWKNPQTQITLPICFASYLINAGEAVSKGFDTQITAKVFDGFTLTTGIAYTDAKQTREVGLPTSAARPIFVAKGDRLPVPKWQVSVGGQYDFDLFTRPTYVRLDYQYNGAYQRSAGPTTTTFLPDTYMAEATNYVSMRAGMRLDKVEASIFVNNLLNSQEILFQSGGRAVCGRDPVCANPGDYNPRFESTTFRPREIGANLTYRF